ncbi:MAG: metallophosphoesterase family protein [Myxococcota bacterium]
MRLAVLSDIHSNLEALEAAKKAVERLGADRIITCGDLVGYNADPNPVVDWVREEKILAIMGNHDAAACGLEEPVHFNAYARAAALWTREALTEENCAFLQSLPTQARVGRTVLVVHGSVLERDAYLFDAASAGGEFEALRSSYDRVKIAFFGHTHYAVSFSAGPRGGPVETHHEDAVPLARGRRYLVNPGSVGQPRDGDPRLSFVLADLGAGVVERHRVAYRAAEAAAKVRKAGLPEYLARRLEEGH